MVVEGVGISLEEVGGEGLVVGHGVGEPLLGRHLVAGAVGPVDEPVAEVGRGGEGHLAADVIAVGHGVDGDVAALGRVGHGREPVFVYIGQCAVHIALYAHVAEAALLAAVHSHAAQHGETVGRGELGLLLLGQLDDEAVGIVLVGTVFVLIAGLVVARGGIGAQHFGGAVGQTGRHHHTVLGIGAETLYIGTQTGGGEGEPLRGLHGPLHSGGAACRLQFHKGDFLSAVVLGLSGAGARHGDVAQVHGGHGESVGGCHTGHLLAGGGVVEGPAHQGCLMVEVEVGPVHTMGGLAGQGVQRHRQPKEQRCGPFLVE